MDVKKVGDQECISCGECINVCPTDAIKWKGSGLLRKNHGLDNHPEETKKARNTTRGIVTVAMIVVLLGSFVYFWQTTPDYVQPAEGNQVGDTCPGYDLTRIDSTGILEGTTINPAETGKITIINFWGTWCTPCVNELPYFDQIATNYPDDVTVIAVHTDMIANTAPEYIAGHYPDSNILFAKDESGGQAGAPEKYYAALGGRDTYPYTVVLDEHGVIIKIFFEALHYEDLEAVVESELNN